MDIIFVRHGRTEMNERGCYGDIHDGGLSKEGISEIERLKETLEDFEFDCIFSSHMKRAMESASIIMREFILDDRLNEMNFGIFEGFNYEEINSKYPQESKKWAENFLGYRIPTGENLFDVYKRTAEFIEDVSKLYKSVLVFTHAGVIRCALSGVFDRPDYFYRFKIDSGTFTTISIDDGYMYIKGINKII